MRRAHLGLDASTPAMLVRDAFTGNFAFRCNENKRREQWSLENNCHLPLKPAGGWSAHGQPCDAWHCMYRRLRNQFVDAALGYHKPGLSQINKATILGANQQKHLQISPQDSIKAMVLAWQEMKKYPTLLCWAWTSRQLVTKEEMAKLRPDVAGEDLETKSTSTAFSELVPGIPLLVPYLICV